MPQSPDDRRRYRRARAPLLARPVGPLTRTEPRPIIDVSMGGLRAYSDEPHKPGERLEMELFFPDRTSAVFLAEVVWIEPLPAGGPARFDVGLRFIDADSEDLARIAPLLADD